MKQCIANGENAVIGFWVGCGKCGKRTGGFATYRVDHDYELFGELGRKIPA